MLKWNTVLKDIANYKDKMDLPVLIPIKQKLETQNSKIDYWLAVKKIAQLISSKMLTKYWILNLRPYEWVKLIKLSCCYGNSFTTCFIKKNSRDRVMIEVDDTIEWHQNQVSYSPELNYCQATNDIAWCSRRSYSHLNSSLFTVRICSRIGPPHSITSRKRRSKWAVLQMRPEKLRPRVTAGLA
jgi:hypothetical protein